MSDTIDYPALIERLRAKKIKIEISDRDAQASGLGATGSTIWRPDSEAQEAAAALDRLLTVNARLHDVIRGYQKRLGEEHGDV